MTKGEGPSRQPATSPGPAESFCPVFQNGAVERRASAQDSPFLNIPVRLPRKRCALFCSKKRKTQGKSFSRHPPGGRVGQSAFLPSSPLTWEVWSLLTAAGRLSPLPGAHRDGRPGGGRWLFPTQTGMVAVECHLEARAAHCLEGPLSPPHSFALGRPHLRAQASSPARPRPSQGPSGIRPQTHLHVERPANHRAPSASSGFCFVLLFTLTLLDDSNPIESSTQRGNAYF